jgi:tRNA A-37 threonylcarbamoyl transferase component Bud32
MAPFSLEGQTLGKYRVLDPLGRGGMAQVYRAYHPQLDRYVALKVLRSDLVDEEEFVVRFRREAQAVAGLRHPNIIQVFDFDVQGDIYFMVMELLEGDTLKARLNDYRLRGEQMPRGEIVRVLLDVLDGLAYAHGEGMIHRDIKPANIMLTKRGQAVIGDFGIAQIVGATRHTVSGAMMGTLSYMAPEQGLEGRSDARSDLYSLGIVLYEMLTQHTPFDADTPLAVLMKHLNDPLPLPRKFDATIPEPFERIVLKALSKRPEERYQSAQEMAQALRQAAEEAAIELPERISLPLSFTTPAAPSESVVVLSGTAKEKITDAQFAKDDTNGTLGKQLAAERAAHATAQPQPAAEPAPASRPVPRPRWLAVLGALALLVGCNSMAIMVSGLLGRNFFQHGWPVELFLAGLVLCAIMAFTDSIWLLIPVGIVLGNGGLLSYYALTGFWRHWTFLWPLEPLLVIGTIVVTLWLARSGGRTRGVARWLGWGLGLAAAALGSLVSLIAMVM